MKAALWRGAGVGAALLSLMLALGSLSRAANPAVSDMLPVGPLSTPEEHRRSPEQTFLTYPEWFLVHSPAEYAAYLGRGASPSGFPLFSHIAQFWSSYAAVAREVKQHAFNAGYHLMVLVIGTSTTVEYGLKAVYERTFGRLAEATVSGKLAVPEEVFAAQYAQSYVDFIRIDPWYRYDFLHQFKTLWQDLPLSGPNLIRRWERRFMLSTELLAKASYARLIKLGTQSVYDNPQPVTAVMLSKLPFGDPKNHPDIKLLAVQGSNVLALVPRYAAFNDYARWLSGQPLDIREVAGNSEGEILISVTVPLSWQAPEGMRRIIEQAIITVPGTKRVVAAVPIVQLSGWLRHLATHPGLVVEHIHDF